MYSQNRGCSNRGCSNFIGTCYFHVRKINGHNNTCFANVSANKSDLVCEKFPCIIMYRDIALDPDRVTYGMSVTM